ncbi:tripartite tricarboxylate transporter TctB family protein [Moraxella cuniculi]|uniref:Tripartite tricarboxylate transporter TctB family n=1 Tax=Moraxella cuniculi TaxID=34061 RepID=A0A3S4QR63_9GAMM|nr:tripartite tricarboxylate transporter TctB family protein [Moraxella cuniculi]VEG12356.1 Tripartite tricarboxylate transporter TctB family [Moraxella cuniculi]
MNAKFERYFAGLLLIVSLFLLYLASDYVAPIAYDPLGPRPYPMLLLALLAACSLFLLVRPKAEIDQLGYTPSLLKKLALCLVTLLGYAVLFELLGFIIATAIMATIVGKLFGGKLLHCLISGVAMGVLLYLLFDQALDVPLPLGLIG